MSTIPTQEVYECRFRLGVFFIRGILVFSVRWDTGWDSMSTQAYYVRNPTIVGFPHFPQNSPWWEVLTTDTIFFLYVDPRT